MKTPIIVWESYLLGAVRGSPDKCPVSRAIEDQTGLPAQVVGDVAILQARNGSRQAVFLPAAVGNFVAAFDGGGRPEAPFAFMLDTDAIADGWEFPPFGARSGCEEAP